jgi:hypothetical protein
VYADRNTFEARHSASGGEPGSQIRAADDEIVLALDDGVSLGRDVENESLFWGW